MRGEVGAAVVEEDVVGAAALFGFRELERHPAESGFAVDAVARHQSAQALIVGTGHMKGAIDKAVETTLEEEGALHEDAGRAMMSRDKILPSSCHAGVDDGIDPGAVVAPPAEVGCQYSLDQPPFGIVDFRPYEIA